ncbi:MAG: sulfatase-like hydrolase/transferase [Thermoanaerobaculia bacterium]|nr:sulfatase-like hydrolase/transferase [Thermoanaerobaculia bacterium]
MSPTVCSRLGVLAAGCGLILACGGGASAPVGGSGAIFAQAPVILISIDTLRSDRLPAYGYRGVETPHLDAFRRDAILYERAYSHYPLTLPSHVSVFTGQLPPENGVRDQFGYKLDVEAKPYLPRLLKKQGYATGAVVSAVVLEGPAGLGPYFDFYEDDIKIGRVQSMGAAQRAGEETLAHATTWLQQAGSGPFLLFAHIYEPHSPYEPIEPFRTRYAGHPYDGEVATADAIIGRFLDQLKAVGLYDKSLIILFSDHGEGLNEHGEQEHGVLLYREALQVPLLVKLPGSARAGETGKVAVGLFDIAPTVLSVLGLPVPPEMQGRSLLDLLAPGAPERPIYSETYYTRLHMGWSELHSLFEGEHHFIQGPDPELYDLVADPGETRNILTSERRVYARMKGTLESLHRPLAKPGAVDDRTSEQLAALGYISSAAINTEGPLPDPKSKVRVLVDFLQKGQLHMANREYEEAARLFGELTRREPGMPEGWTSYGLSLVHLNRLDDAIGAYQKAIELGGPLPRLIVRLASLYLETGRPKDAEIVLKTTIDFGERHPTVIRQLAVTYTETGRSAEAIDLLAKHRQGADTESDNVLAVAYARAGRNAEAVALLDGILGREPGNAKALETYGGIALGNGNTTRARDLLERAVVADPSLSIAWNTLGVARQFGGDTRGALEAWQKALERDPRLYDALYNLGLTAAAAGERALARRSLERYVAIAPPARFRAEIGKARQVLAGLGRAS